ncbi:hypothetical protein BCR42DRAFT_429177 [Absidia repens]|uniref:Uncharacterized protein n=1 Tax=Absidia repens TaxID=90262 RepID=A0A1X2HXC1_9FUNG|nr:hypothetical protein BCR42DRAFT_429177 [Absidia repens]
MDVPLHSSAIQNYSKSDDAIDMDVPLHLYFHDTLIKQLNQQTFLEMILKSKASKHEDRFYAILPQSKYKTNIYQVSHWEVHSLVQVKLRLFEIMDIEDKVNLLFLSGVYDSKPKVDTLPTFATSNISWKTPATRRFTDNPCNFDFNDKSTITLHYNHDANLYYLRVIPRNITKTKLFNDCHQFKDDDDDDNDHNHSSSKMAIVSISPITRGEMLLPFFNGDINSDFRIHLIGSFYENKWLLSNEFHEHKGWDHHYNNDKHTIFNIY